MALALCISWALGGSMAVSAQNLTGGLQAEGTSYYVYARPGQNTIQVTVLGSGVQTGIYELGEGTDLERLVALGGYSPGVRQSSNDRSVSIQLYRNSDGQRELIYDASLEAMIAAEAPAPMLQMGDIARIEVVDRERFSWRDGLSIATAAASIALFLERITRTF
jgi:hypothetical protein